MPPRSKPMRRRFRKPKRLNNEQLVDGLQAIIAADTKESVERRRWVHAQPCAMGPLTSDPCSPGGVDECHVNEGKGVGMKSSHATFPMCRRHHEMYDGQASHKTVLPLTMLLWRALARLLSDRAQDQWQDTVSHETRREKL